MTTEYLKLDKMDCDFFLIATGHNNIGTDIPLT